MRVIVAVVGARWPDLSVERSILEPAGAELRRGAGADGDEIVAVAGDAAVVLAGPRPRLDAEVLERLPCLGVVRYGVGVDNVDLDAAARLGKWVAYVPDYGTEAVALHAVTLALVGFRRVFAADAAVRSGTWGFADLRPLHLPSAATAGIVGLGRIGRRAAQLMLAVGFGRVIGHDPAASAADLGVAGASLDDVLARSDVVSLHAPLGPGPALLGERELAGMKEGSVLVNTARGGLVDAGALAVGLAGGRPAVAALDVFPEEPPDLAVFAGVLDRMILTPHMAWYTEESELALRTGAAQEALRLLRGERPLHPVATPDGRP